jgi:D5 N terminal like/Bifunctional DNA primase/polymerase, N-terminal
MRRQATILDIALQYLAQGWMTIPVPYREKNPGFMGWEHCRLDTPAKLAERFNGKAQNIGVLLGEPSNHTIDVDLDFAECLPFGRMFLPSTRQFGREGNPVSHWLYTVPNAPNRTVFASSRITDDGKKIDTVLEIRGTGHQTVFPTSTHKETGEPILWVGQQPLHKIGFADLRRLCGRVAAGAVLARYWPREKGNRHECALALAGMLLRAGFTVEEAERFIGEIAKIAGNTDEVHTNTVKATKTAMDDGKRVTGWKRLSELLNVGKPIENVPSWLGYDGQTTELHTENDPGAENQPDLLRFLHNDEGNAQRLITMSGQHIRFCHEFRKWLVWDGRRWAIDTTEQVKRLTKLAMLEFLNQAIGCADKAAEKFAKVSLDDKRINAAMAMARPEMPIPSSELNQHPYLLNFLNGTVDLRTGELPPTIRTITSPS